jgi:hypothetical protein
VPDDILVDRFPKVLVTRALPLATNDTSDYWTVTCCGLGLVCGRLWRTREELIGPVEVQW